MALPQADWADNLWLVPALASVGLALGSLLLLTRFSGGGAFLIASGYGLAVMLWLAGTRLGSSGPLQVRLLDLGARVQRYFNIVRSGEPSYDSLPFVFAASAAFWAIAVFGTWWLFRMGKLWLALSLPALAVFLNDYYSHSEGTAQLNLPVFLLVVLALIVRIELTGHRRGWGLRRAQTSPHASVQITQAGIVVSLALVAAAWISPHLSDLHIRSFLGIAAEPSPLQGLFSDALAGLRSPASVQTGLFGSSLKLGPGQDPGQIEIFVAETSAVLPPPVRLYWRARVYDSYQDGEWTTEVGSPTPFDPLSGDLPDSGHASRIPIEVRVTWSLSPTRLIIFPGEVSWVDRPAEMRRTVQAGPGVDVLEVSSDELVYPGDSFRIRSMVDASLSAALRRAGRVPLHPSEEAYTALPQGFSAEVRRLAEEITLGSATDYDKAEAIVAWLRTNIRYDRASPGPPEDVDPVEWFLFESRRGFCDYYASAAVLMLRSVGVPSRLAVGFDQGQRDADLGRYTVTAADNHAWPEVYFPGFGWLEFEPTASELPLDRGEAAPAGGQAADELGDLLVPRGENTADLGDPTERGPAPNAEPPDRIPLDAAQIAMAVLRFAALPLVVVLMLLLLPPVRRTVAGALVSATQRAGRPAPDVIVRWASSPPSEAASTFGRLAPWPARLGIRMDTDATPSDRARAIAAVIPDRRETVAAITDAYTAERYGGVPPVKGDVRRAWRSLRLDLYRAGLARLLNMVLQPGAD